MEAQKEQYRILVVDDSDFSRSNITSMLDAPHYNIIGEASNANEAINILRDRAVPLAIIDVVMPEVSGIELSEHISDNYPATAVIMVSSLAQENIIIDAISAGAVDFLQKPFSKEDLTTAVEKAFQSMEEW